MGGGLFVDSVQAIAIDASEFKYNRVSRKDDEPNYKGNFELNGGGLVIKRSQNVRLNKLVCSQNQARDSGGAISFDVRSLSSLSCLILSLCLADGVVVGR